MNTGRRTPVLPDIECSGHRSSPASSDSSRFESPPSTPKFSSVADWPATTSQAPATDDPIQVFSPDGVDVWQIQREVVQGNAYLPRERFGSSYSNLTQVVALDNSVLSPLRHLKSPDDPRNKLRALEMLADFSEEVRPLQGEPAAVDDELVSDDEVDMPPKTPPARQATTRTASYRA